MQPQTVKEMQAKAAVEVPVKAECEDLLDRMKGVYESITHRAYELFEKRGRKIGHDLEDWLRAEFEMLRPVVVDMKAGETEIEVKAEVPGFKAEDLEISAEPKRLVIHGYQEKVAEEEKKNFTYNERHTGDIFRALELPVEVDPDKATAHLKDGTLNIMLPVVKASEPARIEIKTE